MSIEELFRFISEELRNCPGHMFLDKALADLRVAMEHRTNFKPEKFKDWFVEKNVIYKNNPIAFLKKCGIEDIESGSFDRDQITGFAMYPLCEDMKHRGITWTGDDTMMLDVYLTHIYNNELLTLDEIRQWVRNAVEYIEKHSKTASEFRILLKKSRTMKTLKLNYKALDEEVKKEMREWDKLMNDLGYGNKEVIEDNDEDLPFSTDESETNYEEEINKINNPST